MQTLRLIRPAVVTSALGHLLPEAARVEIEGNNHGFLALIDKALVNPDSLRIHFERRKEQRRGSCEGLHASGLRDGTF